MEPSGYSRRLAAEIAVILAVKLLLLVALWWLFFSPEHRVRVVPEGVDVQLLAPTETK
jgi:hypothetical protein